MEDCSAPAAGKVIDIEIAHSSAEISAAPSVSDDTAVQVDAVQSDDPTVQAEGSRKAGIAMVGVKTEFLVSTKLYKKDAQQYLEGQEAAVDTTNPNPASDKRDDSNRRDKSQTGRNAKRPRETRPDPKDRLCSFTSKGSDCPFLAECQYSHDPLEYLRNKPTDIGDHCYQFETFGYCDSGLMCRFGDQHINRELGLNLSRPAEQGGVVPNPPINSLSKELQKDLRKKSYNAQQRKLERNIDSSSTAYDKPMKLVDFSHKVYVAPLTTVGNLPFRRILKEFGADITCGEMAMAQNLQQGQSSEWALLRRHRSEDVFGVQIAGGYIDTMSFVAQLLENETETDFVDLNCACPIDVVCNKGCGSALLNKPNKMSEIVSNVAKHLSRPITIKIRTGWNEREPNAHKIIPMLQKISKGRISAIMLHGRSRLQRYHRLANWDYIFEASRSQDTSLPLVPIIGNGDILSFEDWKEHKHMVRSQVDCDPAEMGIADCAMLARGALIKPWLPTEIKESRHMDISATERLDILKRFCNYGLEHWGSDQQGVNTTRRFLLEWLSFLHRYVPVGVLEQTQKMQQRPPHYFGRCDLETLLASSNCKDWIRISEMLLGPVPESFDFAPKHKSNSYAPESEDLSNG